MKILICITEINYIQYIWNGSVCVCVCVCLCVYTLHQLYLFLNKNRLYIYSSLWSKVTSSLTSYLCSFFILCFITLTQVTSQITFTFSWVSISIRTFTFTWVQFLGTLPTSASPWHGCINTTAVTDTSLMQIFPHRGVDMCGHVWMSHFKCLKHVLT